MGASSSALFDLIAFTELADEHVHRAADERVHRVADDAKQLGRVQVDGVQRTLVFPVIRDARDKQLVQVRRGSREARAARKREHILRRLQAWHAGWLEVGHPA